MMEEEKEEDEDRFPPHETYEDILNEIFEKFDEIESNFQMSFKVSKTLYSLLIQMQMQKKVNSKLLVQKI